MSINKGCERKKNTLNKCEYCDKTFEKKFYLNRHKKSKRGICHDIRKTDCLHIKNNYDSKIINFLYSNRNFMNEK